ncbi:hypothetical protein [Campylobacter curvus]|jgi:hypothetical protein|uniref:hypothetical protein n=1 Tax=Campylobacter curvus TaxID=200 RepID=UPI00147014AB|nr:hypothetical protein [Campylobacter curvus]
MFKLLGTISNTLVKAINEASNVSDDLLSSASIKTAQLKAETVVEFREFAKTQGGKEEMLKANEDVRDILSALRG